MSISIFNSTAQQQAQFSKTNSGYSATTAGPTTNTYSLAVTSGICYLTQQPVVSGSTFSVDMVSGGLQDLVGNVANISKLINAQVLPYSGAIQVETTQSGGCSIPQWGLSGGGFLVNPGATCLIGEGYSGANVPLSATKGNLVFRAVSGPTLVSFGYYGI